MNDNDKLKAKLFDNLMMALNNLALDVAESGGHNYMSQKSIYKYRYFDYVVYQKDSLQIHATLGYFDDVFKKYHKADNYKTFIINHPLMPVLQVTGLDKDAWSTVVNSYYDIKDQQLVNLKRLEHEQVQYQIVVDFVKKVADELDFDGDFNVQDESFRPKNQDPDQLKFIIKAYPNESRYRKLTVQRLPLIHYQRKQDDSVIWRDVINQRDYPIGK